MYLYATNLLDGSVAKSGSGAESHRGGECRSTSYESSESKSGLHDVDFREVVLKIMTLWMIEKKEKTFWISFFFLNQFLRT